MARSRLLALAFIPGFIGCSGPEETAPPVIPIPGESRQILSATSPTTIVGLPGEISPTPPRVQVTLRPGGKPVAGVKVQFTLSDNRGGDYSAVTDSFGYAVMANFRMDSRSGQYNVFATVAGVGSATFWAFSMGGQLIATYDLRVVGGRPSQGAQYQLYDDGSYRFGIGSLWDRPAPYIERSAGVIEFYLASTEAGWSSFYSSRNGLFAIGTITGDVMKVTYQDFVDYEDEEYSLAR